MKIFKTIIKLLKSERGEIGIEETDGDLLAAQAYEELAAEKEGREPKDLMKKEPIVVEDGNTETTIEDTTEDETETVEDTGKPEKELEKETETQEVKKVEEVDLDKQIEDHAEKHSMTYAQAKEDIEKTEKIIEQFKNDPKEMARALRSKDREYDKLKNQIEAEKKQEPEFEPLTEDQFRAASAKYIEENKDKYFESYRKRFPAKYEELSDAVIIEEIVDREWMGYQEKASNQQEKNVNRAKEVISSFITNIAESDKRFIPEIKAILTEIPSHILLNKDTDLNNFANLAKGRKLDAEVKAAEERGFQRGKESATILGVKGQPKTAKPQSSASGLSVNLNEDQRYRAEEMFPENDGYSQDKAYEAYISIYTNELKNNPNFVG